jgi:adenylate cyclase
MLACTSPELLVASVLLLLQKVEARGENCPSLHAGVTWGPAMAKAGDWYPSGVNPASRLSDLAEPGTLRIDEELTGMLSGRNHLTDLGQRSVDGFDVSVHMYAIGPTQSP